MSILLLLVGVLFAVWGYGSIQPEPRGAVRLLRSSRVSVVVVVLGIMLAFVGILGLLLPVLATAAFALGALAGWTAYRFRVWLARLR